MLTPKFEIGQIFYSAYAWGKASESIFTFCPAVIIIKSVSIDRKGVSYKIKRLTYKNDGSIDTYEEIKTERELERFFNSINESTATITKVLTEKYQELTKELNKEKLKEVLNVECSEGS